MKELRTIVKAYQSIDFSRTRAALVTLVRLEGSSYRRAGARMLVLDDGVYLGGISGGCLEGDALRRAQKAIALQRPSIVTYDTTQDDEYQIGAGLGCNGIIDVLFTPLHPDEVGNPLKILSALTEIRIPALVITITGCPVQWNALGRVIGYSNDMQFQEVFPIRSLTGAVLKDVHDCAHHLHSRSISYEFPEGAVQVFIEVILPATHVVIYGGNYDIHCLIRMASELGWDTTVVMNRAKADKSLIAAATRVLHNQGEVGPEIDPYTAVLLMSHDYKTDRKNLEKVLPTKAAYIGLLGPRKRAEKIWEAMASAGNPLAEQDRQRIYAPAGLDIGASTPEEIALSILAEVRAHFAGRQGMSLRLREGSIYE